MVSHTAVQNSFPLKVSILHAGQWAGGGRAGRQERNVGSPPCSRGRFVSLRPQWGRDLALWGCEMSEMSSFYSRCNARVSELDYTCYVAVPTHTYTHTHTLPGTHIPMHAHTRAHPHPHAHPHTHTPMCARIHTPGSQTPLSTEQRTRTPREIMFSPKGISPVTFPNQ